jgi:outer membrane protein
VRLIDLKAVVSVALVLLSTTGQSFAQQQVLQQQAPQQQSAPNATQPAKPQAVQNDTTGQVGLPQAPQPNSTQPLYLRDTAKDYTRLNAITFHNPFAPFSIYKATEVPEPRLSNTPKLDDLLRDGKLYLSLSDAVTLALENNYDIAIARINLDIADTDILRTRAGSTFRGVSTALVANTLGGSTTTITGGGGPGGTSNSSGTGSSGLVLSTNGGGPQPYSFDPVLTGTAQYERATTPQSSSVFTGTNSLSQNTLTADLGYLQGFSSGTQLNLTFNNTRTTTSSTRAAFSPQLQSNFKAQITQHLLQGFGPKINRRFIIEAENNRRITDSSFRQQVIYTVTQIESIYWALVSAYEDEQAKEHALEQSTKLAQDNRKQLEIGTLAPLDVITSDSAVATDRQTLTSSKSNLEYQQLLMKQAIARNLNDPQLANAPVIPTDRVGLDRISEEDMPTEDLVKMAFVNNPQIEQAVLNMTNNRITIRGEKNGLLPIIDANVFYASEGLGGAQNPIQNCNSSFTSTTFVPCTTANGGIVPSAYNTVLGHLFNNSAPDYGASVTVNIPLRNRVAQADQARSQMEYRQTQMRLQQLYTQIRIQVINGLYALNNDRANVLAAETARDFNAQSLDAEQKKYGLGASTSANVLQQQRTLAGGENNLISATAAYAKDRASLLQLLSNTLDKYGISLVDAASGAITTAPVIPGLTAPKPPAPPKPLTSTPPPLPPM